MNKLKDLWTRFKEIRGPLWEGLLLAFSGSWFAFLISFAFILHGSLFAGGVLFFFSSIIALQHSIIAVIKENASGWETSYHKIADLNDQLLVSYQEAQQTILENNKEHLKQLAFKLSHLGDEEALESIVDIINRNPEESVPTVTDTLMEVFEASREIRYNRLMGNE